MAANYADNDRVVWIQVFNKLHWLKMSEIFTISLWNSNNLKVAKKSKIIFLIKKKKKKKKKKKSKNPVYYWNCIGQTHFR